jgi:hypothetical protein
MTQEDIDLFLESIDTGYTRCNVQPMSRKWFQYHNEDCIFGCGITAALINKNGLARYRNIITDLCPADMYRILTKVARDEFNLSPSFVTGFLDGFDGNSKSREGNTDYDRGHAYGLEKRRTWMYTPFFS